MLLRDIGIEAVDIVNRLRQVVGYYLRRTPEPERGEAIEDMPFKRDTGGEHDVESRNTVGGHDEQVAAQVIGIADLTTDKCRQRQLGLHD